jgi:hypothetical protein
MGSMQAYDKHYNQFKSRQNDVKQQIQDKFKEWRKQLRAAEMKVIDQMYLNYGAYEDKFVQYIQINKRMINDA